MVKLRILEATVCGGQRVEADAIVEASDRDARILLSMGKACLAPDAEVASGGADIPTDASTERDAKTTPHKSKAKS